MKNKCAIINHALRERELRREQDRSQLNQCLKKSLKNKMTRSTKMRDNSSKSLLSMTLQLNLRCKQLLGLTLQSSKVVDIKSKLIPFKNRMLNPAKLHQIESMLGNRNKMRSRKIAQIRKLQVYQQRFTLRINILAQQNNIQQKENLRKTKSKVRPKTVKSILKHSKRSRSI